MFEERPPLALSLIISLGGWGMVLFFDALFAYDLVRRARAESYPTVEGRILQCDLDWSRDSRSARIHVLYTYDVGGRAYTSGQLGSGGWPATATFAAQFASAHPVGSRAKVCYNPRDPSDALLVPGITDHDRESILFLIPINIVFLGLPAWMMLGHLSRPPGQAEGRSLDPFGAALLASIMASVISGLVVSFTVGHAVPAGVLPVVVSVVLGAAILAFGVAWGSRLTAWAGSALNQTAGELLFRRRPWQKPRTLSLKDVLAVDLAERSSQGLFHSRLTYAAVVRWRDSTGLMHKTPFTPWDRDKARANRVVIWLRKRLGLAESSAAATSGTASATSHGDLPRSNKGDAVQHVLPGRAVSEAGAESRSAPPSGTRGPRTKGPERPRLTAFLTLLLGLLAWGLLLPSQAPIARDLVRDAQSQSYPTVEGRILQCDVAPSRHPPARRIQVLYTYDVSGRSYTGSRLQAGKGTPGAAFATDFVRDHPAGSRVTVYYNPSDPSQACLVPGLTDNDRLALLFLVPLHILLAIVSAWQIRRCLARPVGQAEARAFWVRSGATFLTALLAYFASVLVVVVTIGDDVPVGAVPIVVAVVLGAAILAYAVSRAVTGLNGRSTRLASCGGGESVSAGGAGPGRGP